MRQFLNLNKYFVTVSFGGLFDCVHLDKSSNAGGDCESENNNLSSVINPKHFATELCTVFHHEEDDDNDDPADQAKQSEE